MIFRKQAWIGMVAVICLGVGVLPAQEPTPPATEPPSDEPPSGEQGAEIIEESKITGGKIPLLDFLKFIQASTGKLVAYPSAVRDSQFEDSVMIDVLGDYQPLTYEVVKALLEANGYDLWEGVLADGGEVIYIRHANSRGVKPPPQPTEIIAPGAADRFPSDEQLATLILQLKYAQTNLVVQALRELLGIQGASTPTGALVIVNLQENNTLIIRAKKVLLRHIQELIRYIDVEIPDPEILLDTVQLFHADAQDMVSILQEILTVTLTAGTPTPRPSGRPARPGQPSRTGVAGGQ
ncbi:MAG: secretin N-terminal domain-containing protein, partial [Planctomycetota bacterium]